LEKPWRLAEQRVTAFEYRLVQGEIAYAEHEEEENGHFASACAEAMLRSRILLSQPAA
jgi:hypothetical protein